MHASADGMNYYEADWSPVVAEGVRNGPLLCILAQWWAPLVDALRVHRRKPLRQPLSANRPRGLLEK
jgi:hypothetical protein